MSGGARTLRCRNEGAITTATPGSCTSACVAGTAIAGAAERHALRHFAWSIPPPQQSSADTDMLMLSHGWSACAHASTTGPKASQKASSATMTDLNIKACQGSSRGLSRSNAGV